MVIQTTKENINKKKYSINEEEMKTELCRANSKTASKRTVCTCTYLYPQ
jgi:hypothetical protein